MADEDDEIRKPVYHPGPWHIVQATIDKDETWGVNGVVVHVQSDAIIPFMLIAGTSVSDSAQHFIERKRAADLGQWNTIEEFNEWLEQEQARLAKQDVAKEAEKDAKRNGKGKRQHENRAHG